MSSKPAQTAKMMLVVTATILCWHRVCGQLLSKANDDYTPDRLWQLDSAHNGISPNPHSLYATLHDAHLAPGPFTPSVNASILFKGTSSSYAEIPNNGNLDATTVFSWVLLVKPTRLSSDGVLLEYYDSSGGIRLKHSSSGDLLVEAHTTSNAVKSVTANNVLVENQWKFLTLTFMGFSKKKLKLMYSRYDESGKPSKKEVKVDSGTTLRGTGDIRLGGSFDPALPSFSGNIGCLRYYDDYVGKFQDGYVLSCDPSSNIFSDTLDNLSEYTEDYVESTTVVTTTPQEPTTVTTTTTTQTTQLEETTVQTTQQEETTVQTTQQEETTVQTTQQEETTVQTTQQEETTAEQSTLDVQTMPATTPDVTSQKMATVATTVGSPLNAPAAPIGGLELEAMTDSCVSMVQEPGTATFSPTSPILAHLHFHSLSACASECISTSGCSAIAIEKKVTDNNVAGSCILGASGYGTSADAQFYFYHLNN